MTSEQKDSYDSYRQYARLDLDPGTPGLIAPPRADSPLEPCSRLQSPSTATTMPPCPVPPDRRRLQDRNRNVLQTMMLDGSSESHFAGRCQECEV